MHKIDYDEPEDKNPEGNSLGKKVTGYLNTWESNNGYTHKIIVVSIFFVLIAGFLVYRLTVSIDDKPFYVNEKNLNIQKKRMSELSRKNDSLDRVEEIIETRKAERIKAYLEEHDSTDTLDIYGLLNEKR